MIMGLPLRYRYWSVLQVVIIVTCYPGRVFSERAQNCVRSKLSLSCEEMKVISVTAVVLGDSYGAGSICYIRDNDCTYNASANHTMNVHRRCDGQSNCTIDVIQEKINCGYFSSSNSDFERITYHCIDDPRNDMMNSAADEQSTDSGKRITESDEESHKELITNQDDDSRYLTSTYGTLASLSYNTRANDHSGARTGTHTLVINNSKIAQDCVGSQLNLRCPEMKVIEITTVVLGDSKCLNLWSCCIKDDDCAHYASENHRDDVHRRCHNKQSCVVDVLEEGIDCGWLGEWSDNDFERITYVCIDGPRRTNTPVFPRPDATEAYSYSMEYSQDNGRVNGQLTSNDTKEDDQNTLSVVMVIMCLIVLLAIVALLVVMNRRKKRTHVKLLEPVSMTEVGNHQIESDMNANETQGTSLYDDNDPLLLYSTLDEAVCVKTDGDPDIYSEVEQRRTIWNDGQSDQIGLTTDETKAAIIDTYMCTAKPDGVKDIANKGNCFPEQINSYDMEDSSAHETAVALPNSLFAGTVSKHPKPQDDGGQIVLENDLYGMTDNCAEDTVVESPIILIEGAVSKNPSPQDDEAMTVIENDLYCH